MVVFFVMIAMMIAVVVMVMVMVMAMFLLIFLIFLAELLFQKMKKPLDRIPVFSVKNRDTVPIELTQATFPFFAFLFGFGTLDFDFVIIPPSGKTALSTNKSLFEQKKQDYEHQYRKQKNVFIIRVSLHADFLSVESFIIFNCCFKKSHAFLNGIYKRACICAKGRRLRSKIPCICAMAMP